MQTKLTLRLEAALIRRAKAHARSRGTSLSIMVADWFAALEQLPIEAADLPAKTRSLLGALRGRKVTRKDWHHHLERKHLR